MDESTDKYHQLDKALRECEEKYRALFEKIDKGIFVYDRETMLILEANSAMSVLYGYRYDEFVGMNCLELSHEVEESIKATSTADEDGRFKVKTRWHKKKDGTVFPIELDGYAIKFKGKTVGCAVVSDISERKQAEFDLAAEKEQLAVTLHSIGDGVITTDPHGNIIILNKAAEALTGWSCEEAAGQQLHEVLHIVNERTRIQCKNPVEMVLATGAFVKSAAQTCLIAKDGRETIIDSHAAPMFDNENRSIGVALIFRDMTERNKLKNFRQRAQKQKLESIGLLAGGVAHDFNNSLGIIMGHAELAMMEADPSQAIYKDLEGIVIASKRSSESIRALLVFAQKQIVVPEVIDLNKTVADMFEMLQQLIGKNIHLSWNPETNLWAVKADPSQLEQLLANLCVNAHDAIAGIGKIAIETTNCSFAETDQKPGFEIPPGDYVCLSVADDGHGIDKENLKQIFEPFFTTKEFGLGAGLGLSAVYGAVKQNHGFVDVASELEQGTTFRIYLPRKHPNVDAAEKTTGLPLQPGKETVLLVEDDQMLLELAETLLKSSGYSVLAASAGDQAITYAKEYPETIHLLLSDVVMPGMNGKELQGILQVIRPEMRVIFMSGYTAEIFAEQGLIEKGTPFLQKPFSLETLKSKVREVLDQD